MTGKRQESKMKGIKRKSRKNKQFKEGIGGGGGI
jgi:hypothetical protein